MFPPKKSTLIPRTCEDILYGKRDSANVIKVKDFEMRVYPGFPVGDNLKCARGKQKDGSEGFNDARRDKRDSKHERNDGRMGSRAKRRG